MDSPLELWHTARGIGDAICALYAACGAADTLGPVRLHTRHPGWLARAAHPGVAILRHADPDGDPAWIDVSRGYDDQLARADCRKQWYCDNIAPGLRPRPPATIDTTVHAPRFDRTPYVVLVPFSAWPSRHWPASHWRYLVALLHEAGFHAVLLDGPGDGARLREEFGALPGDWATWFWGLPEEHVADLMLAARGVVGLDSGMTHYAALLGAPTVAVMAHLPPPVVFSQTRVLPVTPQTGCTFCRWQPRRGYRTVCDTGCSAIATVAPEQALQALLAA